MADASFTRLSPPLHPQAGAAFRSSVRDTDISVDVGQPMQPSGDADGGVIYAEANSSANSHVVGLAQTAGESSSLSNPSTTATIYVQYEGPMSLDTAQWDRVTGQSGGLTPKATYYLHPTIAGMLTSTKPNVGGQQIAPVGFALSATTLLIQISEPTPVP